MKNVILLTFLLFGSVSFGAEREPVSCLWTQPNGKVRELSCTPYSVPFANLISSLKGVCLFQNGLWVRANLKYKAATQTMKVQVTASCDRGVTVMENPGKSEVTGPAVFDCEKNAKEFKAAKCAGTTTTAPLADALRKTYTDQGKRLINCLRNAAGKRVHGNAKLCTDNPTGAGYCDIVYLNQNHFEGKWWVQYTGDNKKGMQVCKGGITIGVVADNPTDTETEVKTTKLYPPDPYYTTTKESASSDYNLAAGEILASCYIQKVGKSTFEAKHMSTITCAESKCASDEKCAADNVYYNWLTNSNNTTFTATKQECFKNAGGWWVLMKNMKGADYLTAADFNKSGSKRVRKCYQVEIEVPAN